MATITGLLPWVAAAAAGYAGHRYYGKKYDHWATAGGAVAGYLVGRLIAQQLAPPPAPPQLPAGQQTAPEHGQGNYVELDLGPSAPPPPGAQPVQPAAATNAHQVLENLADQVAADAGGSLRQSAGGLGVFGTDEASIQEALAEAQNVSN